MRKWSMANIVQHCRSDANQSLLRRVPISQVQIRLSERGHTKAVLKSGVASAPGFARWRKKIVQSAEEADVPKTPEGLSLLQSFDKISFGCVIRTSVRRSEIIFAVAVWHNGAIP
jgi:hypothetical protein